ncbi:MAG TPA: Flp pilus assembly protein CpaB [Terracidiphilus sp.]|jgi:pilus assembly protein CpaB
MELAQSGFNGVKMNRRLMTIFLVAAVIAGGCCWLVYRLVSKGMSAAKPVATTQVIAAAKDIPLGAVLTTADLTTMSLGGTPPKGAILKQEDAVGRGVITQISQGEPILDSQLAGLGSGGGLAPTIPKGMRACAVRVDEVVGVAGFVIPGMRVDVLVSGNPPDAPPNQGVVTETILQNIQVLSAGTDIQRDAEGKPQQVQVVNLLVTPEQAQLLSLAANSLKIQLVLRNPLDTQTTKVPETAMSNLFGNQNPPPTHERRERGPDKPKAKPYEMVIINGNHTTDEKFGSPEGQH